MFGLSFLSPLFLVGLAAAAIPIAIHLFYRRTEPVIEFAAMRYLRRAPVEQSRHRRLRELLLLALRALALALLACAFARPYLTEPRRGGRRRHAGAGGYVRQPDGPGSVRSARGRALQVVRETPATHAVGVLTFAQTAAVVAPAVSGSRTCAGRAGQLKPGAGATRYRAALQRATAEFAGRPGRIVVITDLQQSGWDIAAGGGVPDNVSVVVERVQAPEANLAVTALTVEDGDAVAVVRSFSPPQPSNDQVVFSVDGTRIGAVPIEIAAGSHAEARLPLGDVSSGALSAAVADRVGYEADNVRYTVLDANSSVAVLAVTGSGHPSDVLYVERALAVASGIGGFRVRSVSGAALSALDEEILNGVDVIVLLGR